MKPSDKAHFGSRIAGFTRELSKNRALFLMMLPGLLLLLVFHYLPMFGIIVAFKNVNYAKGIWGSDWCGFENFKFFITTPDAFLITRNTVLYNVAFIVAGTVTAIASAICLNELHNRRASKFYQTVMFLPFFLSWIVVSYIVYSFLSVDMGFINAGVFRFLGIPPIQWYTETKYWPFIIFFSYLWKYLGYNSVIYLAAVISLDSELYEAATIDGASKWRQISGITLPLLSPLIIIMTLLSIGRMFYAEFGLFYQVPIDTGALYDVTNVIDTFVYRALMNMSDIGMAAAAGLYQAFVGFILVLLANLAVRRIDREKALF